MPTLLTTTIPPEYIGESTVTLYFGIKQFIINLRFTVYGELLEYHCPEMELPDAALRLSYDLQTYNLIKAEKEYLPYRLLLMAFGDKKKYARNDTWKPIMDKLLKLRKGKKLLFLNVPPVHSIAKEIVENRIPVGHRDNKLIPFDRLYKFAIGTDKIREELIRGLGYLNNPQAFILLKRAMRDHNETISNRAIQSLGQSGDIRATQPLLEGIEDTNIRISVASATAMGVLQNPKAVEPLRLLLNHPLQHVQQCAAIALFLLGDIGVIQTIMELLNHTSYPMMWAAVNAFVNTKDVNCVPKMIAALEGKEGKGKASHIAEALGNIGDIRAVPPLIDALKHTVKEVRASAAKALGMLGDTRAVNALAEALNDTDKQVHLKAAHALAKLGDDRALEPLIAALQNNREDVSTLAAERLGAFGDTRAVEPLLNAALKHGFIGIKVKAIEALGLLSDERAIAPLIKLLIENYDTPIVLAAKKSLYQIGKPAVQPLLTALKNKDPEVRRSIADVINRLGDVCPVEQLMKVVDDKGCMVPYHLVSAISKHGEQAVLPLISVMINRKHHARSQAAYSLGFLKDTRAVQPLIDMLKDDDKDVRQFAAMSLGHIANDRAFEPLIELLSDKEIEVRHRTISALGKVGKSSAIKYLLKALKDKDKVLCRRAINALGELGDPSVIEQLVRALKDKNQLVFQNAALVLGKFRDARAVEPLIVMVKYDYLCSNLALKTLSEMGEVAVLPMIKELNSDKYEIKLHAPKILSEIGDKRAIEPLEKALELETKFHFRKLIQEALEKLTNQ